MPWVTISGSRSCQVLLIWGPADSEELFDEQADSIHNIRTSAPVPRLLVDMMPECGCPLQACLSLPVVCRQDRALLLSEHAYDQRCSVPADPRCVY